jgi:hypothetical protein
MNESERLKDAKKSIHLLNSQKACPYDFAQDATNRIQIDVLIVIAEELHKLNEFLAHKTVSIQQEP